MTAISDGCSFHSIEGLFKVGIDTTKIIIMAGVNSSTV